jgi:iron complex transport system permease protein
MLNCTANNSKNFKHNRTGLYAAVIIVLIAAIAFSLVFAVAVGQVKIPLADALRILLYKLTGFASPEADETLYEGAKASIIWLIRMPRVIMALLVGIALAMCGLIMQASVQNPLADPYILGISSGASLGATLAILMGLGFSGVLGQSSVAFFAFAGAMGASMLVLTLAGTGGKVTSVKLILAGMIINALFSAFSNFVVYVSSNAEGIKSVTFWMMGSLASSKWDKLAPTAIIVIAAALFFLSQARVLNVMLLGDEAAGTLGINLSFFRRLYMLISSLLTGIIVAQCGMIGFVGLIIPHIVRGFAGADHRRLLPLTILFGGLFMIWADLVARVIMPQSEIPIGIITAMIGAPVFLYMMVRKGYGFGGH